MTAKGATWATPKTHIGIIVEVPLNEDLEALRKAARKSKSKYIAELLEAHVAKERKAGKLATTR